MSACSKHVKAIGYWCANTHHGPASMNANLRGRIYESSRPYLHQTTCLQKEEESIYGHSSLVGSLLQCYVHAAGFNRTIQVSVVHLGDHFLYRSRHGVETPLSAAVNSVGAFKRNHIMVPVGAFPARRRLCSLDRYDLIGLSVCWGFVGHYRGRI